MFLLMILLTIILLSCTELPIETINQRPRIDNIIIDPALIEFDQSTSITCVASDPNGDKLRFDWSAQVGSFIGSGKTVTWKAPHPTEEFPVASYYPIECRVEDPGGLRDRRTAEIAIFSKYPHDASNLLEMRTEGNLYSWSHGSITIGGTLKNTSEDTFYARLGDGIYGIDQDKFWLAHPRVVSIQRFSESKRIWESVGFSLATFIEGLSTVQIIPTIEYPFDGWFYRSGVQNAKGRFRLRIDYYDVIRPDVGAMPHRDYSNIFEIK